VNSDRRTGLRIAAYSALILFFELALIRYTAGYVRVFSFYLNFVLIATFLGMGAGLLLAPRVERVRWLAIPATLAVFGAVWYFSHVTIHIPRDENEFLWGVFSDTAALEVPLPVVVVTLFALCAGFFVPLGALLGDQFQKLPALRAYSYDIVGSLVGILVFAALSAARTGPPVWFAIGVAVWAFVSLDQRRYAAALAAVGITGVAFAYAQRGPVEYWSPYYRIDVTQEGTAYQVDVNGSFHQLVIDLDSLRAERFDYTKVARRGYLLPYQWVGKVDTALVVGAGTGNDVALLLHQGAKHVDAVEIDPVIARLGKELHKQEAYLDPRVHVHVNDARAFLRRTTQKYDLIIFGTLDSQTLLSGMSSVRLDNYVYTVESFASARAALKPTGSMVLYHMSAKPYIGAKLYQMVRDGFGQPPGVSFGNRNLFNLLLVAGDGASRVPAAHPALMKQLEEPFASAHDDWPYLYLRERMLPGHYRGALLSVLVIAVLLVGAAAGRSIAGGPDLPMFFMGAAFLLVETKSVTEMSLLFGSTWTVNILVFASILVMVLAANQLVQSGRVPPAKALFAGLFITLALAFLMPASRLLWMGTAGQWASGGLMVALPIFFAALIFSTLFGQRADAPRALAWNLLGAIVGGVLEYSSMAFGIKALYLIAAMLYALAWFAAKRGTLHATPAP
jgi:spermidine synthase